jgi:hypothetical protein
MNHVMSEKDTRPAIEAQIVENLRRVYSRKLEEDVPERFLELLKQLKQQDGDDSSGQAT